MDTKTFYGTRPCIPLALVPENPQDSDADLSDSDNDPIDDPDYQPIQAEGTGDSSFERRVSFNKQIIYTATS